MPLFGLLMKVSRIQATELVDGGGVLSCGDRKTGSVPENHDHNGSRPEVEVVSNMICRSWPMIEMSAVIISSNRSGGEKHATRSIVKSGK